MKACPLPLGMEAEEKTRLKIVYLNYLYDVTHSSVGAAVHVEEQAAALRRRGHIVKVYYLNRLSDEPKDAGIDVRSWMKARLGKFLHPLSAIVSNFTRFRRELKILQEEKPDLVWVRYQVLLFSAIVLARMKKVPVLLEVNAPAAYENRTFEKGVFQLPLVPEWIEKMNLRLTDASFVVSVPLKEYYLRWGIPERRLTVIPNGVDDTKFDPKNRDGSKRKTASGKGTVIGFVGSFHYWHGMDMLLRVVKEAGRRCPEARFLLVGDGPMRKGMEKELAGDIQNGRVVFTGFIGHDRIPETISAMDVVLALYPGMTFFYYSPLKLYEYMASGKAVLASRVNQVQDLIEDGVNGMLFEPDHFDELMTKLDRLVSDGKMRKRLGEKAVETIREEHTWGHSAEKLETLMVTLIAEKGGA